jgi:myo-inositol 2-dehydrogenase/D-chiro-inositol 1-dehydrogenase
MSVWDPPLLERDRHDPDTEGMGMTAIRVAVIGTGIMGADHARILHAEVCGAEVVLLADADPQRARGVADGIDGARVASDGLAAVADPAVDAVVVASPDDTHADLVMACVAAGKPVLCEKPLAPTLAESARVLRTAGADGAALLSLGFMRRFDPGYLELAAALAAGACGTPLLVHCVNRGVFAGPDTTSEYSVTAAAVHEFDAVPWLLGSPIREVSWFAPRCSPEVSGMQDPQLILLRTADGVLVSVESFLNARYGFDIRCEVVGEWGTVALAPPVRTVVDTDGGRVHGYPADWRPRFAEAYRRELQAWVHGITTGTPSGLATAYDGLVASAVAEAVVASMHAGGGWRPVQVPEA